MELDLLPLSKRQQTDVVGLRFELCARQDAVLDEYYAKGLDA